MEKPKAKEVNYWTDIYDLPGRLARIMGHGGAYKRIDQKRAWIIANNFVKDEFEYRFDDFITIDFLIETAEWLHNIAWDNSILLFDKRKYEIVIIDITDTHSMKKKRSSPNTV